MSPARARTSDAEIVAAARGLLEERGLDAVTMAAVALSVGVRPASLYKHVADRATLIRAISTSAAGELGRALADADPGSEAPVESRLQALAEAYRAFARRGPRAAALLFADLEPEMQAPVEAAAQAARTLIDIAATLVGPARALAAARVMTAYVHGFTSMEAAGAFRLGGGVEEAYRLGLSVLLAGLRAEQRP